MKVLRELISITKKALSDTLISRVAGASLKVALLKKKKGSARAD